MARSTVGITAGTDADAETYTATADGAHRQGMVIVDPNTDGRPAFVTSDNRLQVKTDFSGTPVTTQVPISITSQTAVAADATQGRLHVILFNDTTQLAYLRFDTTAVTTSNHAFEMVAGAYWESPRNYVGALGVIWSSTTGGGNLRVTVM